MKEDYLRLDYFFLDLVYYHTAKSPEFLWTVSISDRTRQWVPKYLERKLTHEIIRDGNYSICITLIDKAINEEVERWNMFTSAYVREVLIFRYLT